MNTQMYVHVWKIFKNLPLVIFNQFSIDGIFFYNNK